MTGFRNAAAAAALFSMVATPVAAADLSVSSQRSAYAQSGYDAAQDKAERYRRWRGRDRVDAGDVIAGVAIIAGIAAIASAVDSSNKRKRERYEEPRDDYRYDAPRYDQQRQYQSGNLDRAVNACTSAVSQDVRVDSVDQVSRVGEGWEVRGRIYNGSSFTCAVSGDGRIDRIDYAGGYQGSADTYGAGDYGADAGEAPGQLSDDAYAMARAAQGGGYVPQAAPQGAQPAYPGGPLPEDEIDGDLGG